MMKWSVKSKGSRTGLLRWVKILKGSHFRKFIYFRDVLFACLYLHKVTWTLFLRHGKKLGPITLTESHTALQVSVVGSNANSSSAFNMRGNKTGRYIRYSISDRAGNYYGPSSPIILNGTGISLIVTPNQDDLNFAEKDIYKDTLIFIIG